MVRNKEIESKQAAEQLTKRGLGKKNLVRVNHKKVDEEEDEIVTTPKIVEPLYRVREQTWRGEIGVHPTKEVG